MIRIKRLYSEPECFDPISFEDGINIILGEKSTGSNKTNGVGKSLSIEFLNFCLLKKANESRVMRIPNKVLDTETKVRLDLKINEYSITITRTKAQPDLVIIHKDGKEIIFDKLDDASEYLGNLYFEHYPASEPRLSFRNLLAPIIRDERSEFKDIIKCFDTDKSIPRDYKPHLFFLGLSIDLYSEIKKIISDLERKTKYLTEVKRLLTNNGQVKIGDAKASLNELESEVSRINKSIEKLRSSDSFDVIQNDIIALESSLKEYRIKQQAIKYEVKQIEAFPTHESISENEIQIVFNQFRQGLGDMVQKSLEDVKEFKTKIDSFRNRLINNRLFALKEDLYEINKQVRKLDNEYAEKLALIDNGEVLKDLKTSINIFNRKNDQLNSLRSLIERYDSAEREKRSLNTQRITKIGEFDELLTMKQKHLKSFEKTILNIHESIFSNRTAHFEIKTSDTANKKDFLEFDLRTDDDGSYSIERTKVFIYDTALMFNKYTSLRHPQFLVHDNIFNIDQDSLVKCLNFLYHQEQNLPEEFQYILTLNRDRIEDEEKRKLLDIDIDKHTVATFTKEKRFLRIKYSEQKK